MEKKPLLSGKEEGGRLPMKFAVLLDGEMNWETVSLLAGKRPMELEIGAGFF